MTHPRCQTANLFKPDTYPSILGMYFSTFIYTLIFISPITKAEYGFEADLDQYDRTGLIWVLNRTD